MKYLLAMLFALALSVEASAHEGAGGRGGRGGRTRRGIFPLFRGRAASHATSKGHSGAYGGGYGAKASYGGCGAAGHAAGAYGPATAPQSVSPTFAVSPMPPATFVIQRR